MGWTSVGDSLSINNWSCTSVKYKRFEKVYLTGFFRLTGEDNQDVGHTTSVYEVITLGTLHQSGNGVLI